MFVIAISQMWPKILSIVYEMQNNFVHKTIIILLTSIFEYQMHMIVILILFCE